MDRGRLLSFNRAIVGSLSAAAGALPRSFDMGDAGLEICKKKLNVAERLMNSKARCNLNTSELKQGQNYSTQFIMMTALQDFKIN